MIDFGKGLRCIRQARGMSQTELAEKSDLSVSYVSLLERGKRDPVLSTITKIAEALEVSLVILFWLAEDESGLDSELERYMDHVFVGLLRGGESR